MKFKKSCLFSSGNALCLTIAISFGPLMSGALAAVKTWDGNAATSGTNGTGANLMTAVNWSDNTLPAAGDTIQWIGFDSATTDLTINSGPVGGGDGLGIVGMLVDQANALTIGGSGPSGFSNIHFNGASNATLTIAAGAGAFTLGTNGRIALGSGTGTTETFTLTNDSNNAATFTATSNPTLGILGGTGPRVITITGAGTGGWTMNNALQAGEYQIIKEGATQLTLAGTNVGAVTGSSVTLKAGTLNLNNVAALFNNSVQLVLEGGVLNNTSGAAKVLSSNNPLTLNGDFSYGTVAGTALNDLSLGNGAVTLGTAAGTSRTITTNGGGVFTIAGAISNGTTATSIIKSGSGILKMDSPGTYTGGFTLQAGALHLQSSLAPGTGPMTINGGAVVARSAARNIPNPVTVGGDFTIGGTAIANAMNFSGTMNLTGNRTITLIDAVNGTDSTISGVISGGGLTKAGPGQMVLSGANTFTGPMVVSDGTLLLQNANPVNGTSGITVNGSAAKLVNGASGAIISPITLTLGAVDLTGSITNLTVANDVTNQVNVGAGSAAIPYFDHLTFQGAASVNLRADGIMPDQYLYAAELTTNAAADVVLNVTNVQGAWTSGVDYPLIEFGTYASVADLSHFVLGTVPGLDPTQQPELVRTSNSIVLRITGTSRLWTGAQNANWTTATVGGLRNWTLQGSPAEFTTGSSVTFDDTGSTTTVNLAENIIAGSIVFFNTTKDYTVSSAGNFGITGGSLVKNGDKSLTITTANSYTGSTKINSGLVSIQGTGSIASSSSIENNGTLDLTLTGATNVYANPISGTGAITKSGAGGLTLSGTNTFTGALTLNGGVLNINSNSAWGGGPGAFVINGGVINNTSGNSVVQTAAKAQSWNADVTFTGTNSLDLGTGAVTIAGSGTDRLVTVSANTLEVGEIKATAHGLTKQGPGVLTVASTGTAAAGSVISGPLNVSAGTLQINRSGDPVGGEFTAGGLTGTGTITNGAAVERRLLVNTGTGTYTFDGVLADGAGAPLGLGKQAAGTLILTGNNTFTGVTTIGTGIINLRSSQALGGSRIVTTGNTGYVQLEGGISLPTTATFLTSNDGNGTTPGAIVNVSGDNTINGVITMTSGAGGTAVQSDDGSLTLAGNVTSDQSRPFFLQGDSTGANTVSGMIINGTAGTNSVQKRGIGTWTLTGANTYTGATTITAGTLRVGAGGTTGNLGTGAVVNNASLVFNRSDALEVPNAISGLGSVSKAGAGTTTLSGANTYTGETSVVNGTLSVTSAFFDDAAAIQIATAGTLDLATGATDTVLALYINGVQQASGTWGSLTSGATHKTARITGTGLLDVTTGVAPSDNYTTWASSKGLTSGNNGATQDPDFDGISNALEFVLGGKPLASDTAKLPVLTTTATDFIFTFSRDDASEAQVGLVFEHGSTLTGSWTSVAVGAASSGVVNVSENGTNADTIVITIPKTSGVNGKLFGRLRAVK